MMTFNEFVAEANDYAYYNRMNQRYGQAVYNYLSKVNPSLAQEIPQEVDCFYDDEKCNEFFEYVKTKW